MLQLNDVHAAYGAVQALRGVSLTVPEGSVVALLGANGAGKSSTLKVVSGLARPWQGHVYLDNRRIDRWSPERIVRMGVVQVPEGRQLFPDLNVRENLMLGAYTRRDGGGIRRDLERMFSYFPVLEQRLSQRAGLLSGGEQQMLAIARALMTRPRLLLLDEPSLGLAPLVVRSIFEIIATIHQEGEITILLVEQDAMVALGLAQYGYVLAAGRVTLEGDADSLRSSEAVRHAYLGI